MVFARQLIEARVGFRFVKTIFARAEISRLRDARAQYMSK
jgi:hypothetical protein